MNNRPQIHVIRKVKRTRQNARKSVEKENENSKGNLHPACIACWTQDVEFIPSSVTLVAPCNQILLPYDWMTRQIYFPLFELCGRFVTSGRMYQKTNIGTQGFGSERHVAISNYCKRTLIRKKTALIFFQINIILRQPIATCKTESTWVQIHGVLDWIFITELRLFE